MSGREVLLALLTKFVKTQRITEEQAQLTAEALYFKERLASFGLVVCYAKHDSEEGKGYLYVSFHDCIMFSQLYYACILCEETNALHTFIYLSFNKNR